MNAIRTVSLLVVPLLSLLPGIMAQTKSELEAMVGVSRVYVPPVYVCSDFQEAGRLPVATLQTDVELKLRQAGLQVVTGDAHGYSMLLVSVNCSRVLIRNGAARVYHVILGLHQMATVNANKAVVSLPTWDIYRFGLIGESDVPRLRQEVRDCVDAFLNVWLAANPRR